MRQRKDYSSGAALVVTLIVMVVLAGVAVAFMQNTGIDRSGARSLANAYRARLAAESGLAEVMAKIGVNTSSDDFIVLRATTEADGSSFPVYFVGALQDDTVDYVPLFSGGRRQDGVESEK